MYYSNGYDTSGVTNIALIGWGEGSTEPNISNISGMISSYIYNSFSKETSNIEQNEWQINYTQYLKHGAFNENNIHKRISIW